jgi:predicted RNA-binding Zn-ribbon protein involved in translation (DUF1610 family)
MRDKENEMKEQDSNICESCNNVTDSFRRCENCGWIRCNDCYALAGKVSEGPDRDSVCPNCGSNKIVVFSHGRKVSPREELP